MRITEGRINSHVFRSCVFFTSPETAETFNGFVTLTHFPKQLLSSFFFSLWGVRFVVFWWFGLVLVLLVGDFFFFVFSLVDGLYLLFHGEVLNFFFLFVLIFPSFLCGGAGK